jgi:hypothetical protein
MRHYPFPLAAALVILLACSSHAAEKPRPAQSNQTQPKKVWTNDDMDQLRARGLISIVGQEVPEAAQPAPAEEAGPMFPVYQSRLDDPEWYFENAADLQAELNARMADLQEQLDAIAAAKDRITTPGISLVKQNAGVTLNAGTEILEGRVEEIQSELDDLSDLARQHDIPPGVLRDGEEAASSS